MDVSKARTATANVARPCIGHDLHADLAGCYRSAARECRIRELVQIGEVRTDGRNVDMRLLGPVGAKLSQDPQRLLPVSASLLWLMERVACVS